MKQRGPYRQRKKYARTGYADWIEGIGAPIALVRIGPARYKFLPVVRTRVAIFDTESGR